MPAVSDEPKRAVEAGRTGDSDVVGIGRALALRTYHDAALRPGQPTAARDGEGGERGRGASGLGKIEEEAGRAWLQEQLDYYPGRCWARSSMSTNESSVGAAT